MTLQRRRPIFGIFAWVSWIAIFAHADRVFGKSLDSKERAAIERHLVEVVPTSERLRIAAGHTVFVERTIHVATSRVRRPAREGEYEGFVRTVDAPRGIVAHARVDEFHIDELGDGGWELRFRYAIHAEADAESGGALALKVQFAERSGMQRVIAALEVVHTIEIGTASHTERDLACDFFGYRHHIERARSIARELKRAELHLSIDDESPIPSLASASAASADRVRELEHHRRRAWIAHRHLVRSAEHEVERTALARRYLENLDATNAEMARLPKIALVEIPPANPRVEEVVPPPPRAEVLEPLATYEASREQETTAPTPELPTPLPQTHADAIASEPSVSSEAERIERPAVAEEAVRDANVPGVGERPKYSRGLVLEDPRIAHAATFRFHAARIDLRESADTMAFFFGAETALTGDLGLEVTVPTDEVDLDLEGARSIFTLGNPRVALKYRALLPPIATNPPVLGVKLRLGVPISAVRNIPPTRFEAWEWSREARFDDTYAFMLEKTSIGLGAVSFWQLSMFQFGAELFADGFVHVEGAKDASDFVVLEYGASLGALPFGDLVAVFVETKGIWMLSGPGRFEPFVYAGVRGRPVTWFEPAVWGSMPLGSISRVSGAQLGAELRFFWDVGPASQSDDGERHALFE